MCAAMRRSLHPRPAFIPVAAQRGVTRSTRQWFQAAYCVFSTTSWTAAPCSAPRLHLNTSVCRLHYGGRQREAGSQQLPGPLTAWYWQWNRPSIFCGTPHLLARPPLTRYDAWPAGRPALGKTWGCGSHCNGALGTPRMYAQVWRPHRDTHSYKYQYEA